MLGKHTWHFQWRIRWYISPEHWPYQVPTC